MLNIEFRTSLLVGWYPCLNSGNNIILRRDFHPSEKHVQISDQIGLRAWIVLYGNFTE